MVFSQERNPEDLNPGTAEANPMFHPASATYPLYMLRKIPDFYMKMWQLTIVQNQLCNRTSKATSYKKNRASLRRSYFCNQDNLQAATLKSAGSYNTIQNTLSFPIIITLTLKFSQKRSNFRHNVATIKEKIIIK